MTDISLNNIALSQALDLYKEGSLDEAQQLFLSVLNNEPENPDAIYFMAMIDHQGGRSEVAEHRASELVRLKPKDGKALNLLGTILMSQGKTTDALPCFEKGIKHNETDPVLRVNAAICNIGAGKPEASIEHCKKAIDLNPDYPNAYNILGNAYMGSNDMESAVKSFQQVLEKHPDFHDARFNLGVALFNLDRYDEALECFDTVLSQSPENTHALTRKAEIFLARNELQAAGPFFEQAIKSNPQFSPAHAGMGKLFQRLQKHNEALSHFKRAIELNPDNIEALVYTGDSFRKLDQTEAAAAAYQDALSIDPDNVYAKFHLAAVLDTPPPAKPDGDYVKHLFDALADTFDDSLGSVEYNAPEQLIGLARQLLSEDKLANLDILDMGCGTGLNGLQFKPIASTLQGIDISPRMLSVANQRGIYDDLEENDLLSALVRHQNDTDLAVSADTFPYFGDLESIFMAVVSALRDSGLFMFTVETHDNEDDYLLGQTARYSHSRNYVEELAKRRGLEILACNDTVYRKESGADVKGLIVALRKS